MIKRSFVLEHLLLALRFITELFMRFPIRLLTVDGAVVDDVTTRAKRDVVANFIAYLALHYFNA